MNRSVLIRAGLGSLLIGAGLALMLSARRSLCVDCEDEPEATIADVAAASAEVQGGDEA